MAAQFESATNIFQIAGVKHGFFTRQGGVSAGIYASLNGSTKVGDDITHVLQNRFLAKQSLGVGNEALFLPNLVHGNNVVVIDENTGSVEACDADALITSLPNRVLAITYADCVPILLSTASGSVVGAIHAGWRGMLARVIEACLSQIAKLSNENIVAAIGPAISQTGFRVTGDVKEYFLNSYINFVISNENYALVDLRGIAKNQLIESGVKNIEFVGGNTDLDSSHYFSHRAQSGKCGRNLALIAIS